MPGISSTSSPNKPAESPRAAVYGVNTLTREQRKKARPGFGAFAAIGPVAAVEENGNGFYSGYQYRVGLGARAGIAEGPGILRLQVLGNYQKLAEPLAKNKAADGGSDKIAHFSLKTDYGYNYSPYISLNMALELGPNFFGKEKDRVGFHMGPTLGPCFLKQSLCSYFNYSLDFLNLGPPKPPERPIYEAPKEKSSLYSVHSLGVLFQVNIEQFFRL